MESKESVSETSEKQNEDSREAGTESRGNPTTGESSVGNVDHGAKNDCGGDTQPFQPPSSTLEKPSDSKISPTAVEKPEKSKTAEEKANEFTGPEPISSSKDTSQPMDQNTAQGKDTKANADQQNVSENEQAASKPSEAGTTAATAVVASSSFTPPESKISRKVSFSQVVVAEEGGETVKPIVFGETSETLAPKAPTGSGPATAALQAETASVDNSIEKLRAPLVNAYGPFLHPSDTCLEDARNRLRTALEQTRQLRSAFTQNVYDRYRILLKPVPKSTDDIINPIKADPLEESRKLAIKIREHKEEKSAERKENHILASAKQLVGPDGAPLPNAALASGETVDQLAYITTGLSFIILPEEDIDESQITVDNFEARGPMDPATREPVAGLSAAAASTAVMIVDRARRSAALQKERKRRRQLQTAAGAPEAEMDSAALLRSLQQLTDAAARGEPAPLSAPTKSAKALKRGATKAKSSLKSANKHSRARATSTASSTLLNLHPSAEALTTVGKPSAAAAALMSRGVGAPSGRALQQQRLRHPYPDSAGGRRSLLPSVSASTLKAHPSALPPAPYGTQLRDAKKVPVLDHSEASKDSAITVMRRVVEKFVQPSESDGLPSDAEDGNRLPGGVSGEENEIGSSGTATEITLLHDLTGRKSGWTGGQNADSSQSAGEAASATNTSSVAAATESDTPIDPVLAFTVLQALGLVRQEGPGSSQEDRPSRVSEIDPDIFDRCPGGSGCATKLKELLGKIYGSRGFSKTVLEGSPVSVALYTETASADEPDTKRLKAESSEVSVLASGDREPLKKDEVPAMAIRGGGEVLAGGSDSETAMQDAAKSEGASAANQGSKHVTAGGEGATSGGAVTPVGPKRASSAPPSQDSSERRVVTHGSDASPGNLDFRRSFPSDIGGLDPGHSLPYSPPRSGRGHPRTAANLSRPGRDRLYHQPHAQALDLHGAPAHHLHGHHQPGDLSHFLGLQHGSGPDWSGIGAASLLQSPHSLSMNLSPHRAALMSLSVRDQAARAILLQEQQNAAAAAHAIAAHQQASAVAAGLSHHEAALFLGTQPSLAPGAGLYAQQPSAAGGFASSADDYFAPPMASLSRSTSAPAATHDPSFFSRRNSIPKDSLAESKRTPASPSRSRKNHGDSKMEAKRPSPARQPLGTSNSTQVEKETSRDSSSVASDKSKPDVASASGGSQPDRSSRDKISREDKHESADRDSVARKQPAQETSSNPSSLNSGLKFFPPAVPPSVSNDSAAMVMQSRFHDALRGASGDSSGVLDYLVAVGAAVPIPKALVVNPLKERLTSLAAKNQNVGAPPSIPREIVCSAILVWLWEQHKDSFQRAFAKSGRIDVDPECKWLIQTAIDTASRAVIASMAEKGLRKPAPGEKERGLNKISLSDAEAAAVVSEALMKQFYVDKEADATLPLYEDLVDVLDECRLCALRARTQERALLANLLSRQTTMTDQFSHTYVSAMVRAGEGLGHEELLDLVNDDDLGQCSTTLLPFDIVDSEGGGWEDPGHPEEGFATGLTGDELFRRANARAVIQKSLKALQDRHNLSGGTPSAGPYTDPPPATSERSPSPTGSSRSTSGRGLKRKSSLASTETSLSLGTGSAAATSMALYNPNHHSMPLFWDGDELENKPYGTFTRGLRRRSLSLGRMSFDEEDPGSSAKRRRVSRTPSLGVPWSPNEDEIKADPHGPPRSTYAIPWGDVAMIFEPVELPDPSSMTPAKKQEDSHSVAVPAGTTIIAPFVQRTDEIPGASSDDEDFVEEDLSDEAVLARHRSVLDIMAEKIQRVKEANPSAFRGRGRPPAGR